MGRAASLRLRDILAAYPLRCVRCGTVSRVLRIHARAWVIEADEQAERIVVIEVIDVPVWIRQTNMADMSDDEHQQGLDEMIDTCHSDIHDDDEQIAFVFCPQELGGSRPETGDSMESRRMQFVACALAIVDQRAPVRVSARNDRSGRRVGARRMTFFRLTL